MSDSLARISASDQLYQECPTGVTFAGFTLPRIICDRNNSGASSFFLPTGRQGSAYKILTRAGLMNCTASDRRATHLKLEH